MELGSNVSELHSCASNLCNLNQGVQCFHEASGSVGKAKIGF